LAEEWSDKLGVPSCFLPWLGCVDTMPLLVTIDSHWPAASLHPASSIPFSLQLVHMGRRAKYTMVTQREAAKDTQRIQYARNERYFSSLLCHSQT
jgi:hypothetical protein